MHSVLFVAPFPMETTMRFARAAASLPNTRLLGVFQELPRGGDRAVFADVVQVSDGLSARQLLDAARHFVHRYGGLHRIVGVLEPLQEQLAAVRQALGVPGTDSATAELFRDKAKMKDCLRAAGLPVARHDLLADVGDARRFAERVGFPMVLKPPAGMGAKSTFRVASLDELLAVLSRPASHPWLAEEFLTGEEGSFDTITVGGRVVLESISHYRPTPLEVLENPWIQWCCVLPRTTDGPAFDDLRSIGIKAIEVLGLNNGFTHMEWFRRPDGRIAIGEIAQRPPGAHIARMIGLAYQLDPYLAWARAEVDGVYKGPRERRFSVGCAYLRGMTEGRVRAVTGVDLAQRAVGPWVVEARLPTIGAAKSSSYEGDGYAIVRDTDTRRVEAALATIIGSVRVHYA